MKRIAIAMLLVLAACGDPSGVSDHVLTGTWSVGASDLTDEVGDWVCSMGMALRITQNAGQLTGSVVDSGSLVCTSAGGVGGFYGNVFVGTTVNGGDLGPLVWMRSENWRAALSVHGSRDTIYGEIKFMQGETELRGPVVFVRDTRFSAR